MYIMSEWNKSNYVRVRRLCHEEMNPKASIISMKRCYVPDPPEAIVHDCPPNPTFFDIP